MNDFTYVKTWQGKKHYDYKLYYGWMTLHLRRHGRVRNIMIISFITVEWLYICEDMTDKKHYDYTLYYGLMTLHLWRHDSVRNIMIISFITIEWLYICEDMAG